MQASLDVKVRFVCCDLTSAKGKRNTFNLPSSGRLPKGYEFVSVSAMNFDGKITVYVSKKRGK